ARAINRISLSVEALNRRRIAAAGQRHLRGPVRDGSPRQRVNRAIDRDAADVDGRRARQGDEIAVRAEVAAAIEGDCETGWNVGGYQSEQVTAPLAEVG